MRTKHTYAHTSMHTRHTTRHACLTSSFPIHNPTVCLLCMLQLIPHRPDVKLEGLTLYKRHMVVSERQNGLPALSVQRFADEDSNKLDGDATTVTMPEEAYVLWERNSEYDSNILRYVYASFTTPTSIFDIDMDHLEQQPTLKKETVRVSFQGLHARHPVASNLLCRARARVCVCVGGVCLVCLGVCTLV